MNTYKVTFSNGDYLYTQLNASIEEAKAYYLGNIFNLGTEATISKNALTWRRSHNETIQRRRQAADNDH